MDGTEISPEELAGRTGHLKMVVTYTNNSKKTTKIDGKNTEIYSPFVMVTGMILSTDNFSNITVDNWKGYFRWKQKCGSRPGNAGIERKSGSYF